MQHTPTSPGTVDQFDQITARLDQLRADLSRAVRALPDRALPAVFALAVATDHLRAAAVALDQATDQIEAAEADQADHHRVDSTTCASCGAIGADRPHRDRAGRVCVNDYVMAELQQLGDAAIAAGVDKAQRTDLVISALEDLAARAAD